MGLINRKKKIKEEEKKVDTPIETTAVKSNQAESSKKGSIISNRLILKPLITEKAAIAQSLNKYSFIVIKDASKVQIKKAIKEIYGIEPKTVNLINMEGKKRRFGRSTGRRSDYKKAVVTLPSGKSITIHEGV